MGLLCIEARFWMDRTHIRPIEGSHLVLRQISRVAYETITIWDELIIDTSFSSTGMWPCWLGKIATSKRTWTTSNLPIHSSGTGSKTLQRRIRMFAGRIDFGGHRSSVTSEASTWQFDPNCWATWSDQRLGHCQFFLDHCSAAEHEPWPSCYVCHVDCVAVFEVNRWMEIVA